MDPEAAGLRERKKQATRVALRDAARVRFAREGFSATRVADIAADVGVSERTFFRYFEVKEDAALSVLTEWLENLFDAMATVPAEVSASDALVEVLRQGRAGKFPLGAEELRDLAAYRTFPEVQSRFSQVIDVMRIRLGAHLAERAGRSELDPYPRVFASLVTGGLFSVMESWLLEVRDDDPWLLAEEVIGQVASDFLAAVGDDRTDR